MGIDSLMGSGIYQNKVSFAAKIVNGMTSCRSRFLATKYTHFLIRNILFALLS